MNRPEAFWRRDWVWALLLAALILVAYERTFGAGFIWDDESHLTQNPCVVGPLGLKEIWTSTRAVYYPLVLTTFWALHKFVGLNPFPYHILNVLLHAASAVLLWRVLRQLGVKGAWLGAALWALHPVMVQSVAWITELKNTQSCFFYLLSIFCFLIWEEQRGQGAAMRRLHPRQITGRHFFVYATSLCFFLLAVLSKPSVVMLPAVLALCVWWRANRVRVGDALTLIPFLLISALSSGWTIWEQKFHARALGPEWAQAWPERLIIAGRALWFYLGKLVWPEPLIFIYPRWQIQSAHFIEYLPLLVATGALILLWFLPRKAWRGTFFAAEYYVISLFPVLGFFDVFFFRYSFVSDHFQYIASMGPLALAAATITEGLNRLASIASFGRGVAFLRAGFCGALLLLLAGLTWQRTGVYHDLVSLYTDILAKNAGCWMAHYNLGIALHDRGEADQAITHYRQAIELRPSYTEAHYNLARLLADKGEFNEAIDHYEAALSIDPDDAETHNNLGATLFQAGHIDAAIAHYQKALELRPDYASASCNLADAFLSKGAIDDAIAYYVPCVGALSTNAAAQYNLASALFRKGKTDEAITHYKKTLELLPGNADAHANLGSALLSKGRVADAIAQYREALRVAPGNVAAQSNLAWLLATSADPGIRNGTDAVVLAENANRLSGAKRPAILRILAAAYAEAGRFSEARDTAHAALQAADDQGNSALSDFLRQEITLYESDRAYHKGSQ